MLNTFECTEFYVIIISFHALVTSIWSLITWFKALVLDMHHLMLLGFDSIIIMIVMMLLSWDLAN